MLIGAIIAWFLVDAKHIVRKDGSRVILMKHPTWQSEIIGLYEVMKTDWYIALLFPMFFASNFFYTYQFQDVNLARFTVRTRSLNGVLYWLSQILGAYIFGYALDFAKLKRTMRAKVALGVLFVFTMGEIRFCCLKWTNSHHVCSRVGWWLRLSTSIRSDDSI